MNDDEIEVARQKEDAEIAILIGRLTRLGLIDLPNERLVRRIIEGQLEIVARDARLMHEDKVQSDLDERLLMFQTHATDKATAYNNAVLTLGYAGFFTVWTLLKENLTPTDSLLVGLLLGFSLFVFVVWTVLNALLLSKAVSATASVFSSNYDSNEDLLEKFRRQENLGSGPVNPLAVTLAA
jgi:hypothetical protein